MPNHKLSLGLIALVAAAVVLPAPAQAEHENRYFGFGYRPNPWVSDPPPVVYPPRQRVRERAPGIYEYEVAPGHWVRVRPGRVYEPPRQRDRRTRTRRQPRETLRVPGPPPVPKSKPDTPQEPEIAVQSPPDSTTPSTAPSTAPERVPERAQDPSPERAPEPQPETQQAAAPDSNAMSCEAAADIVRSFGFSDVQSTSCSGDIYGFEADRDGKAYAIRLSAADGELTEVRKR
ncbi:MAG: hypothetical protein ACOC71_07860 [Hyphomicrobiales bacterium]